MCFARVLTSRIHKTLHVHVRTYIHWCTSHTVHILRESRTHTAYDTQTDTQNTHHTEGEMCMYAHPTQKTHTPYIETHTPHTETHTPYTETHTPYTETHITHTHTLHRDTLTHTHAHTYTHMETHTHTHTLNKYTVCIYCMRACISSKSKRMYSIILNAAPVASKSPTLPSTAH